MDSKQEEVEGTETATEQLWRKKKRKYWDIGDKCLLWDLSMNRTLYFPRRSSPEATGITTVWYQRVAELPAQNMPCGIQIILS